MLDDLHEHERRRPATRLTAAIEGGERERERDAVACGHERLLVLRRPVDVRRDQRADRHLPERVVEVARIRSRGLADDDEEPLPQVGDGPVTVLDLALGDLQQQAAVPEGEQDARVGDAHVAVAAHVRLVLVVDDVRRELPRLLPVEPGAEAGESQSIDLERCLGVGWVAAVGLGDDGVTVELVERLVEALRGKVAVAVPQGAHDALVGIFVVEPRVRPHRQAGAPQLGAVGRPDGLR